MLQIATDKTIYLDGQPTRLALAQREGRTVIYSPAGGGMPYTEHPMPHARYSAAHDAPASGVAGRSQLEADLRELLARSAHDDITWVGLDHALRGTGADAQAYANQHRMLIVEDEDAAQAGSGDCWWGTTCLDRERAIADYLQAGGTASCVYVPA